MTEKKVIATILTLDGKKEISGKVISKNSASSYSQLVFVDEEGREYDDWQVVQIEERE